jgi:hypothetical protein
MHGHREDPVTDETPNPTAPDPEPGSPAPDPATSRPGRAVSSAETRPRRPDYRGEELDPERGPGLGCFWFQVIVLGFFIVLIPIGLKLNWPFELLAFLLFVVIGLLLITGQSVIFLLRLVAADRRAQGRRRPVASKTMTVGELEDEQQVRPATDPTAMQTEPAGATAAAPGDAPTAEGEPTAGVPVAEAALDATDGDSADPGPADAPVPDAGAEVDRDEGSPAPDDDQGVPDAEPGAPSPDVPPDLPPDMPPDLPPDAAPPEEPDPGVRQ